MKPGIYLVADVDYLAGRSVIEVVMAAISGGVSVVQLRAKNLEGQAYFELANLVLENMKGSGIPLLLNDRADVALATGSQGLHIGQKDLHANLVREMLGPDAIIGLSVETMQQVEDANHLPIDYVAASPVFATPTKTDTAAAWGLQGLQKVAAQSRHPVCAIGGLNEGNLAEVRRAGAQWAALVSAICGVPDPEEAAKTLGHAFGV